LRTWGGTGVFQEVCRHSAKHGGSRPRQAGLEWHVLVEPAEGDAAAAQHVGEDARHHLQPPANELAVGWAELRASLARLWPFGRKPKEKPPYPAQFAAIPRMEPCGDNATAGESIPRLNPTQSAEADWLKRARFNGLFHTSAGSALVVYACGSCGS
jgi:hypothetical protein